MAISTRGLRPLVIDGVPYVPRGRERRSIGARGRRAVLGCCRASVRERPCCARCERSGDALRAHAPLVERDRRSARRGAARARAVASARAAAARVLRTAATRAAKRRCSNSRGARPKSAARGARRATRGFAFERDQQWTRAARARSGLDGRGDGVYRARWFCAVDCDAAANSAHQRGPAVSL